MLKISDFELKQEARLRGYRPEMLKKVYHLLELLEEFMVGTKGRLEIDLNYVHRIPLWSPEWRSSPSWPKATKAKVLDIHKLAAGKLNALLEREVSRDLFDSHQLLTKWPLDIETLRLAFTVYAGMRKQSWQQINIEHVKFSVKDIRDKLIPVLKTSEASDMRSI